MCRRHWPGWRYASFLATLFVVLVGAAAVGALTLSSLATSGSAGVTWRGDLETRDFGQWDCGVQEKVSGRGTIVSSPVRQGRYAARFEIRPGDNNVAGSGSGERTEALSCRTFGEGEEQWWAWSTMFAPDFSASNSGWNIFTQFHNSGTTGGRVEFFLSGSQMYFVTHGGQLSSPAVRQWKIADRKNGKWYDFVFHVKWSEGNTGFVEVWLDGNKVVSLTNTPTLYIGQEVYLKQGYYREAQSNVAVLYHDGARQGTSYADVASEFPGASTPVPTPAPAPVPAPAATPVPAPAATPVPAPAATPVPAPAATPEPAGTAAPTQGAATPTSGSPASAPTLIPAPAPGSIVPLELQPYVIEWDDRLFRDVGVFRSYLIGRGVDWSAFLERHPAVVEHGGLLAVEWGGEQFYDQASLSRKLSEQGISYRQWAENHPLAAAILAGKPVQTTQRVAQLVREKRVVIRWSGISFTSANGLRLHLSRRGTDWNLFLVGHPAVAQRLGLASVSLGGARFYTTSALSRWLQARGTTLTAWKIKNPGFVEKLMA